MNLSELTIESFGATDVGLVRLNNEDIWGRVSKKQFFILADGMGGHAAGEVAAAETVFKLCAWVKDYLFDPQAPFDQHVDALDEAIRQTNLKVYELSHKDKKMAGMGTTLCLAWMIGKEMILAHVGDSRIYRIRRGRITQLTHDHSLRDELIAKGELDESLAPTFPYKNVITRAIGTQPTVTAEILTEKVISGDLYFLCSDGLTDALSDTLIRDIIISSSCLEEATTRLIQSVKSAGGTDNITILIFKII